jgi:hypothetical protein
MIRQAAAARQDLLLRDLLEWAELREMCLRVLCAFSDDEPLPALRLVRDGEPGGAR